MTRRIPVTKRLPLSALLSQALVAFTIEFDNEFEHRMPHRTTRQGGTGGGRSGPWLVSMVMWWNCMRFVTDEGVTVRELERLARTKTNLNGMERWGYVVVEPDPNGKRAKPPGKDWVIRPTAKGRRAQEVWRPLDGEIEERWNGRFGADAVGGLRKSLAGLARQVGAGLPDCLPILGYGLWSRGPERDEGAVDEREVDGLPLPALLARVLLAFAMEFERESELSLAICADVVRVIDEKGVRVRDLPRLSGVSKEALRMAMGILEKRGDAVMEAEETGSRTKVARLTAKGRRIQDAYGKLTGAIEERWEARFGRDVTGGLRKALEGLNGGLSGGLEPYPDGWRAGAPRPETLAHYPMTLHRGGYPDGS
jgi:DNA-binding MarR family transcriptional regulator